MKGCRFGFGVAVSQGWDSGPSGPVSIGVFFYRNAAMQFLYWWSFSTKLSESVVRTPKMLVLSSSVLGSAMQRFQPL